MQMSSVFITAPQQCDDRRMLIGPPFQGLSNVCSRSPSPHLRDRFTCPRRHGQKSPGSFEENEHVP
ncbi:hypothetical protein ACFPRL_23400 [Pseudoclavibacter helvolus]